jgi:hypothetical protein
MTIVLLQEVGWIRHASPLDILTLDRDLSLSFAIALIDVARPREISRLDSIN